MSHIETLCYPEPGEYCEPGYTSEKPILFGNWNGLSRALVKALESHFTLDWSDEWLSCSNCGRFFRSVGDSYSWSMYGWITDGECLCGDCILSDPSEYIAHISNNPSTCAMPFIALEDHGFINLNGTLQNGFFSGMNDNPKAIMTKLKKEHPTLDIVFGNLKPSQFYIKWEVYGREKKYSRERE
jgi:hypothetical protein